MFNSLTLSFRMFFLFFSFCVEGRRENSKLEKRIQKETLFVVANCIRTNEEVKVEI